MLLLKKTMSERITIQYAEEIIKETTKEIIKETTTEIIYTEEGNLFLEHLYKVHHKYVVHGATSPEKVKLLHKYIYDQIIAVINLFPNKHLYKCKMEYNVKSGNPVDKKKCDIVVLKEGKTHIVIPIKFSMSNCNQNKISASENLVGEIWQMKSVEIDKTIKYIPINILYNKVPYLKKDKIIEKFETITYDKSFKWSQIMLTENLIFDQMNYIIDVEHICKVGSTYNECPKILGFNEKTPYRSFYEIMHTLF